MELSGTRWTTKLMINVQLPSSAKAKTQPQLGCSGIKPDISKNSFEPPPDPKNGPYDPKRRKKTPNFAE